MKKKVLITGAYGFIGRYVARQYELNNCYVIGMGHGSWLRKELTQWGIDKWYNCDLTLENLLAYGGEPDVIVHCAGSGSVGFSIQYPIQDFDRTVKTMQYVLEYVRLYSPNTKVVYPSSAAVYGTVNELPINEGCALNPISPYGEHKKIAEQLCLLYARQYDINIAIVRLFSVYGRGLRKQLLWDACNKLVKHETKFFGTGNETRDWVEVKDVASLLYIAHKYADKFCPVINGGSGIGIKVKEILSILFNMFGCEKQPEFIGTENIGNPVHYLADIKKAREWGWNPRIHIEQGIEDYVLWYKEGKK